MFLFGFVLWVFCTSAATAQFNDTVKFTLTSMDPMLDFDRASGLFAGRFTLDPETGHRTSAGRSSGAVGGWFVGTGFEMRGLGKWKSGQPTSSTSSDPLHAFLFPTNRNSTSDEVTMYNGSVRDTPDLFKASNLSLSAYQLQIGWGADGVFEFHNVTIDIPVRTQA